jgi:hypothetical protein
MKFCPSLQKFRRKRIGTARITSNPTQFSPSSHMITICWDVTPCISYKFTDDSEEYIPSSSLFLDTEDRGSMFLRNFGKPRLDYKATQPTDTAMRTSSSRLWYSQSSLFRLHKTIPYFPVPSLTSISFWFIQYNLLRYSFIVRYIQNVCLIFSVPIYLISYSLHFQFSPNITTLWASAACHRDSFPFFYLIPCLMYGYVNSNIYVTNICYNKLSIIILRSSNQRLN